MNRTTPPSSPIAPDPLSPVRPGPDRPSPVASRPPAQRLGRGLLGLALGSAIALPLLACQPTPAPAPRVADGPTTAPVAGPRPTEPAPRTVEVVREKIVYVDRPVAGKDKDEVIARVGRSGNEQEIRFSDIRQTLFRAYGLNVTLNVVQLKLAQAEVKQRGLFVSDDDIKNELNETLVNMFPDATKDQYPNLLTQLLQQQKLSRAEFDLVMEINTNLRKIALSQLEPGVKDEVLREAFNVLYGETVRVKHIACANLQEVAEVKKRLAAGVPFESVAKELSRNGRTGPLGGELPPFSRAATDVTAAFKDMAFSLSEGEVSDAVKAEGSYHVIKLERRIPPRAVKFEDVKDSLAVDLRRKATDSALRQFRQALADQARETLKILDPALDEQWKARVQTAEKQAPPPTSTDSRPR